MKRVKMFFAAVAVLGVVGGAVAFKSAKFNAPNLKFCNVNVTPNVCALTDRYTTVANGTAVTPPYQVYTGTVGALCASTACPTIGVTVPIYTNF